MSRLISLAALAVAVGCSGAQAQYTDGTIKIGVMNDMSGTYSDLSGQGSVVAARMAVEDVGGKVLGKSIEIIIGDHQNKPDVASAITHATRRASRTYGAFSCIWRRAVPGLGSDRINAARR